MAKIIKRTKKDGTCSYCIRVSNGYDRQGRQVLVNRTFTPPLGLTGKKLEKELQRQADAFEQEVHSGISLEASMKLDDLIEKWFTEYADRQLKPKTATEYRKLVPRVSAALGHMKVNQIRPAHLMAFYANLSEDGVRQDSTYTATAALLKLLPKGQRARIRETAGVGEETMRGLCSGKPVSRKTAEKVADAAGLPLSKAFTEKVRAGGKLGGNTQLHYHRFLSSVFEKAVKWQLIDENPCRRTEAPKAAEIEVEALQEEDVAKLLEALQDAPAQYSVITQLALLTGARRGEICALRWSDIDLDAGVISINRTVQNIAGRGTVFTAPKTKRSRRCIKIGPECVQLLREYRQHQKAERFKVGSEWMRRVEIENGKTVDNDLLFTRWNGQPLDPNAVTSWFPGFLAAHDLPAVHFHSLRHPYVKHTTKIFSLRLMDFQAQAYPDARRKTRGACQLHRGGQSRSPVRPLCNRKRFSCLPPQSKMSWILYAISMRLSGYTSTRSISSSASSVVSVSASKIALDASLRLSCRVCSSCFCFACANTAA